MTLRQVVDDMLGSPAPTGHDHPASPNAKQPAAFRIGNGDVWRAPWRAGMLDSHDSGIEPDARRLPGPIERSEADRRAPDSFHRMRSVEHRRNERLDHEPREAGIPIREHLVA